MTEPPYAIRCEHGIPSSGCAANDATLWDWYAGYGSMLVRLDRKAAAVDKHAPPRWIWRELVVSTLGFLFHRPCTKPSV